MLAADYVIVGSGLTGAVIARSLLDAALEVLLPPFALATTAAAIIPGIGAR
jgi:glycine/D-amino acid oxidase-like deaminating enzyme